jgi:plasmid segregation protein ParM
MSLHRIFVLYVLLKLSNMVRSNQWKALFMTPLHNDANRAIDLGYGWVKFATGNSTYGHGDSPTVPVDSFQSIVWSNPAQFGVPELSSNKLLTVRVGPQLFAVSKEPESVAPRSVVRMKGDDYVSTTQYAVCMAAAIKAMRVGSINTLVVGTPVGNYVKARQAILSQFSSGIQFDNVEVPIKRLRVVPQPIGGLFWHMVSSRQQAELMGKIRLLIDVGYGTLDWVVANGSTPNAETSGSNDYGVSKFIDVVAGQIKGSSHGIGADLLFTSAVDQMLTMGRPFDFAGRPQHIDQYGQAIDQTALEALQDLKSRVGSFDMISSILVMGGGAKLYARALKRVAGDLAIEYVAEPQFANVRGFQLLAEAEASQ